MALSNFRRLCRRPFKISAQIATKGRIPGRRATQQHAFRAGTTFDRTMPMRHWCIMRVG